MFLRHSLVDFLLCLCCREAHFWFCFKFWTDGLTSLNSLIWYTIYSWINSCTLPSSWGNKEASNQTFPPLCFPADMRLFSGKAVFGLQQICLLLLWPNSDISYSLIQDVLFQKKKKKVGMFSSNVYLCSNVLYRKQMLFPDTTPMQLRFGFDNNISNRSWRLLCALNSFVLRLNFL